MNSSSELVPSLQWLDRFPRGEHGFEVSPVRAYSHPEGNYDEQYNNDPANLDVGLGAVRILQMRGCDFSAPALEIGCGTGLLTLGLVAANAFPGVLVTDPSPAFLGITQRKLAAQFVDVQRCAFATLTGEEMQRLPAEAFSLVVLRSVLHHVLDVEAFMKEVGRVLKPGGAFVCEEPCGEGYLLMATLAQFIPVVMEQAGRPMTGEQVKRINFFLDTMRYYLRRDVDKSQAEDKHLFWTHEMSEMGQRHGLTMEFFTNFCLPHFLRHSVDVPAPFHPYQFMKDYLQYCMNFGPDFVKVFDETFAPYARILTDASCGWSGPPFRGVYLWKKNALAPK